MINKKLLSFDRKALRYVGLNVLSTIIATSSSTIVLPIVESSRHEYNVTAGIAATAYKKVLRRGVIVVID